ncbi:unnamed protein product, partial [Candidula unifasciata]
MGNLKKETKYVLFLLHSLGIMVTIVSSLQSSSNTEFRGRHTYFSSSKLLINSQKDLTDVWLDTSVRQESRSEQSHLEFDLPLHSYLSSFLTSEPHPAFSIPVPPVNQSTLTLGYLVEDRARHFTGSRDWKLVSGALSYAVSTINEQKIIPGFNLTYVMRDTRMQTNDSLMAMSNLWRDGVVGFIGSATSCQNEAMLAGAWNLPILSHICPDDKVSDKIEYPTFTRTFPPADRIITSVVSLLKHFRWNKFSVIYAKQD